MDTPLELIASFQGKVGEFPCKKEELLDLQQKYRTGTVIQREDGIYFRVVGDNLPQRAVQVQDNLSLEEVYLYYLGE